MSLLADLGEGASKGLFTGVGSLLKDVRVAITGVDPEKAAELQQKVLDAELAIYKIQTDINVKEAENPNLFVSGWRPAVGWVCVLGLLYQFIARPLLPWAIKAITALVPSWHADIPPLPELDMGTLMTLLMGMLGIGTLRTVEKVNGVANK